MYIGDCKVWTESALVEERICKEKSGSECECLILSDILSIIFSSESGLL